ncbi:MAG: stage II sporulation protein D [Oscillospiraceae bacterium]|nr:stage II sporulation protein D [Oscillospiraceae bacterium]
MKIITIVSVILTAVAMTIAMAASLSASHEYQQEEYLPEEYLPTEPPALEELLPREARADSDVFVRVRLSGEVVEMSMERYLIGVVAAEMPASFELEALKAQAVAARTDALHKMHVSPKMQHPEAHVCGDFTCCVAFLSDEQLREKWGYNYTEHISRIISAVTATDGVFLAYRGEPILAVFHSSSSGMTEASGNVWVVDKPYLQSVESPETQHLIPGFVSAVTVSVSDFIETVSANYPNAVFAYDEETWITGITYTESGRIAHLSLGGAMVSGTSLRAMFDLRSTAVSIALLYGDIVFTTRGFGHGVGMSQHGANIMAQDGKSYREILLAYYTGVEFVEPGAAVTQPAWD